MGKRREQAEWIVRVLGSSYRDARALRRRLQRFIEAADMADAGWIELVAGVEDVEYRLRCVLRAYEGSLQHPPGPPPCPDGDGGTIAKC